MLECFQGTMLQKAGECKARSCTLPTVRGGKFVSKKTKVKHGNFVTLKCDEGSQESIKCNFGQLSPAPTCDKNGKINI